MLGAFGAVGALQGVAAGRLHEQNLDESYQMMHEQQDYSQQMQDKKYEDQQREQIAVKNRNMASNSAIKGYQAMSGSGQDPSQPAMPPEVQQPQPTPQAPSASTGPIKPTMPPMQQGQQVAQNTPQQGNDTQVASNNNLSTQPPQQVPPPPPGNPPPTAPAATHVMGPVDDAHTMTTKDPYDIGANAMGHLGPNGIDTTKWNQGAHDQYMGLHASYPNLTPQAIAAQQRVFLEGGWEGDEAKFNEHMAKLDDNAAKVGEVPPTVMGDKENQSIQILKDNDILGKNAPIMRLSPAETAVNNKQVEMATQIKAAANTGMDTFSRMISRVSGSTPGPGQSTEQYIAAGWAKLTNTQRSTALNDFYENEKDHIQALNANIQLMKAQGLSNMRVGKQLLDLESKGIPDLNSMSPAASLAMAQTFMNNFKQLSGAADALIYGGEHLRPSEKSALADIYTNKNPAVLQDGQTPNPNFQDFTTFQSTGGKGQGITQAEKHAEQGAATTGAIKSVDSGGKGETPKTMSTPQDAMKLPPGTKFYDSNGTLRTRN